MRIISQSGTDYPYEQICIQIQNNQIKCKPCNNERVGLLASYSSSEKAQKAMEMLHQFYDSNEFMKKYNYEKFLKIISQCLSEKDFNKVTSSIFRFPADEEIEVGE